MRLNNSNFQLADLICKSIAGTLTEEEEAVLTQWKALPENEELWERLVAPEAIIQKFATYDRFDSRLALQKVKSRIGEEKRKTSSGLVYSLLKYAAVLLLVGLSGYAYFYMRHTPGSHLDRMHP